MLKYELVLFDADGTLFNYDIAEKIALKKVFEHHKFEYGDDILNTYREINSHLWREFENGRMDKASLQTVRFENLLKEYNFKADPEGFNTIYLDFLAEGKFLIDGALEVCRELSQYCTLATGSRQSQKLSRSCLIFRIGMVKSLPSMYN